MEPTNSSFFKKYKFTLISLFIIVLAAIPLLLLSNTGSKPKTTQTAQVVSPTPTSTPVTTSNVEPTLTQVDTDMQTTLNQVDTDLQSVSQVDTTKDSTSGL